MITILNIFSFSVYTFFIIHNTILLTKILRKDKTIYYFPHRKFNLTSTNIHFLVCNIIINIVLSLACLCFLYLDEYTPTILITIFVIVNIFTAKKRLNH